MLFGRIMTCYCDNKQNICMNYMGKVRSSFMLSWWYIHSNACVSIAECVIVFALFDNGHSRQFGTKHTSEDDTNLPTADTRSNVPVRWSVVGKPRVGFWASKPAILTTGILHFFQSFQPSAGVASWNILWLLPSVSFQFIIYVT